MDVSHYRRLLGACFARPVVPVGVSRTRLVGVARGLVELGAPAVLAISCNADGADPPAIPGVRWWSFGFTGRDQRELDTRFDSALREPPAELVRALDEFDPAGAAWVLDNRDLPDPTFVGRRRFGWRRPRWASVEDKVLVGPVWERAGIDHAPSLVVPARQDAVLDAARRLDAGAGTVWAADARDGLHGGAVGTRWVRDDEHATLARRALFPRSDRIRVMPFLEGLPCSIHGLVCPDDVVTLRPLELLTLRRPDGRFLFAGTSTHWDCPDAAAAAMRTATRRIGAALRELVGYRGGFTVDGVLTADGFLPTEINARLGTGLNIDRTRPELQFFLLNRLLQEDAQADVRPAQLEAWVNDALARCRDARVRAPLRSPAPRYVTATLRRDHEHWTPDDTGDTTLSIGPSDKGDHVVLEPGHESVRGNAIAPLVVAAFALAERKFGVDVGPLSAAEVT